MSILKCDGYERYTCLPDATHGREGEIPAQQPINDLFTKILDDEVKSK